MGGGVEREKPQGEERRQENKEKKKGKVKTQGGCWGGGGWGEFTDTHFDPAS